MSHDQHKLKHSKRRYDTNLIIKKRKKLLKEYNLDYANNLCIKQPHRLSRMNGINCGNPGCMLCINPRKYGEKTIQELSFEQTEKWSEE